MLAHRLQFHASVQDTKLETVHLSRDWRVRALVGPSQIRRGACLWEAANRQI